MSMVPGRTRSSADRHEYLLPVLPGGGPWGLGRAGRDWPESVREVALAGLDADSDRRRRPAAAGGNRRGGPGAGPAAGRGAPGGLPGTQHAQRRCSRSPVHPLADQHAIPVVHVTHFNALFWDTGSTPTVVIEHGMPDPGHLYTGELPELAVVVNEPVRRGRVTGTDLLARFAAAAPLQVFGMGGDGLPPAHRVAGVPPDRPRRPCHGRAAPRTGPLPRVCPPHAVDFPGTGPAGGHAPGHAGGGAGHHRGARAVPPEAGAVSTDVGRTAPPGRAAWSQDPDEARDGGRAPARRPWNATAWARSWPPGTRFSTRSPRRRSGTSAGVLIPAHERKLQ